MSTSTPTRPSSTPAARSAPQIRSGEYVTQQIDRMRRSVKVVDIATSVLYLLSGLLGVLLLAAVVEHWVVAGGLSTLFRTLLFFGLAVVSGYYAWRHLWPYAVQKVNPAFAAQTIERENPTLKNSLLNLLLIGQHREQVPEGVYQTLEQHAARNLRTISMDGTVDRTPLVRIAMVFATLLVTMTLYKVISPKDPILTAVRVLAPWTEIAAPSRVRITDIQPGTTTVTRGETVPVSANVRGLRNAEEVVIRYSTDDNQAVDLPVAMRPSESGLLFSGELPAAEHGDGDPGFGVQRGLSYRIEAGDARSKEFAIHVIEAPTITVTEVEYDYPEYTGYVDQVVEGLGDIHAIEGTRVTVHARANGPIEEAYLDFESDGRRDQSMQHQDAQARAEFELALRADRHTPQHTNYVLRLTAPDGRKNRDPVQHTIDVRPDYRPEIELLAPEEKIRELRLNETATIEVGARDPDFALAQVTIHGRVEGTEVLEESLLDESYSGHYDGRFQFTPARHGVRVGDVVEYWATAHDNRAPEPNVANSNRQRFRIVDPDGERRPPEDQIAQRPPDQGNPQQGEQGQQGENGQQGGDAGQQGNQSDQPGQSGQQEGSADQQGNQQGQRQQGAGDQSQGEAAEQGEQHGQSGNRQDEGGGGNQGEAPREQQPGSGGNQQQSEQEQPGETSGEPGDQPRDESGQAGADEGDRQQQPGSPPDGRRGQGGQQDAQAEPGTPEGDQQSEPVSSQGDNDGEAFERIARHLNEQSGKNQPETSQQDGSQQDERSQDDPRQRSPDGQPQGQREQEPGHTDQPNPASESPEHADEASGQESNGQQQGEQSSAEQSTSQQSPTEQGQETNTEGARGDGNQQGEDRQKPGQDPDDGSQQQWQQEPSDPSEDETPNPEPPGAGSRKPDSAGEKGGEQTGSGNQNRPKDIERDGTGTSGEGESADEGTGESAERGTGRQSTSAGDQQQSDQPTGQPGEEAGERGSSQRDGTGQQPGGKEPGDPQSAADGQDRPADQQPGQGDASQQGESTDPQSGGERPSQDQQPGQSRGQQQNQQGQPGGTATGEGGSSGSSSQSPGSQGDAAAGGDEANLEYARKQTDLVLDKLSDMLQDREVDQQMLDELGWSEDDLKAFIERWRSRKSNAQRPDASDQAQQQLRDALRSLGLKPRQLEGETRRQQDTMRDLNEGVRQVVPPEFQQRLKWYNRGVSRGEED